MDTLFKTKNFRTRNLPMPTDFWNIISKEILSSPDQITQSAVLKPSLSIINGITIKTDLLSKSVKAKTFFTHRKVKLLRNHFNTIRQPVEFLLDLRKRSVDKITSKLDCLLTKFVKNRNKIDTLNDVRQKLQHQTSTQMSCGNQKEYTQPQTRHKIVFDNPNTRRKSTLNFFGLRRDQSTEKRMTEKCVFNEKLNILDERRITYLKRTLSSMITDSVYVKDFFKLYDNYKNGYNKRYHYRSKSASNVKTELSTQKQQQNEFCSFSDYVYNIYTHFNIKKERITKYAYMMDKSTILFSELDIKPETVTKNTDTPLRQHFAFNFLTVNKYLKEFCHTVKYFNKSKKLVYIHLQGSVTPKYKIGKIKLDIMITDNIVTQESENHALVQQLPNLKTANLFQKLVQNSVINEKHQTKKKEIHHSLTNCLRKSFFYLKRDVEKKRMQTSLKNQIQFKSIGANRLLIDINTMFKMPKTMNIENFSSSLKNDIKSATKNFRLKNFDGKSKPVLSPYAQKFKVSNYV